MANYIRSGFYTFKPGTLDPLIEKSRQELPPLMQRQPGFLRYAVVRTGPDSIASLTAWETRAQSEAAAQQLVGWVKENFGANLVSAEDKIGEVILSDWSAGTRQPGWGRVHDYTFRRPVAAILPAVREGYLPLLRQQPGFNSYTVWQTADDACTSYLTFDSKEQGEAAIAAAMPWLQEHIAPDTKDVQRVGGELVWTVRNR
jgi:hypothetical protein